MGCAQDTFGMHAGLYSGPLKRYDTLPSMRDARLTEFRQRKTSGPRLGYDEALGFVMGLADFERSTKNPGHAKFHLDRMKLLMEQLGNPNLGVPAIHIAGTNGKGSTAAMITSVLTVAGYKTGLYTSPHLHSAVERIRVGLDPISREDYALLVDLVWTAVQLVGSEGGFGPISTFEAHTAMAFLHFMCIEADVQVLEVGLGGRLDATNVVTPEVCVITPISLDHTQILGDNVALIAAEKAGIIKSGVPVVVAPQPKDAMGIFRNRSSDAGAPLVVVDGELSWKRQSSDGKGQSFHVDGLKSTYNLWIPLLGDHQVENAVTAVATLETLAESGFRLTDKDIVEGIRQVEWPGRIQVFSSNGRQVVMDGAHNPAAMKRLVSAVQDHFEFNRVILVFGGLNGHSTSGMLTELEPLSPVVAAVRSRHPRSASSEAVADVCSTAGFRVEFTSEDVGDTIRRVLGIALPDDLVLVTGSLSIVAEAVEELAGIAPEMYPYLERPPEKPLAI